MSQKMCWFRLGFVMYEDIIEDLMIKNRFGFRDNKFYSCRVNVKVIKNMPVTDLSFII